MLRSIRHAMFLVLAAIALWAGWTPWASAQEGPHRAGLVVRFADGAVETRCVAFAEPSISGAELLARAGLPVIADHNSGLGSAVCSIRGQGCAFPKEDCFCKCQGSSCEYWAYYHLQDGRWVYSDVGAGSFQVTDGAVEGWSWGKGNFSSGTEPPVMQFEEICSSSPALAATTADSTKTTAAALPTASERTGAPAGTLMAVGSEGNTAVLTRYISFALFAAALAGGWAWILIRRKRSDAVAAGEHKL